MFSFDSHFHRAPTTTTKSNAETKKNPYILCEYLLRRFFCQEQSKKKNHQIKTENSKVPYIETRKKQPRDEKTFQALWLRCVSK